MLLVSTIIFLNFQKVPLYTKNISNIIRRQKILPQLKGRSELEIISNSNSMLEMCSLFAKLKPSLGKLYIENIIDVYYRNEDSKNLNRAVEKFYLNKI